jgi:hypothetical protein
MTKKIMGSSVRNTSEVDFILDKMNPMRQNELSKEKYINLEMVLLLIFVWLEGIKLKNLQKQL